MMPSKSIIWINLFCVFSFSLLGLHFGSGRISAIFARMLRRMVVFLCVQCMCQPNKLEYWSANEKCHKFRSREYQVIVSVCKAIAEKYPSTNRQYRMTNTGGKYEITETIKMYTQFKSRKKRKYKTKGWHRKRIRSNQDNSPEWQGVCISSTFNAHKSTKNEIDKAIFVWNNWNRKRIFCSDAFYFCFRFLFMIL